MKKKTTAMTSPTMKRIQANCVAIPAMPEKPNTPAMSAMTRNITAQLNMTHLPVLFRRAMVCEVRCTGHLTTGANRVGQPLRGYARRFEKKSGSASN
jgi:hypothetical protein